MNKPITIFYLFAIGAALFFASWFVLHNTIYFHTDLARDFLLFEEIVLTKKPVLIGPRTSMQGVFHGPAWLYLNLPVFIASEGNPVASGWFWVGLIALSIGVVYEVSKRLLSKESALPIATIYALVIASAASSLYNPFGAVFLSPLFFYFFILYLKKSRFIHLIISLFLAGLSIQFEMVWGVPLLVLMIPVLFHHFIINKKFSHISSFAVLALPLSTFILFDLRHEFIQVKSILRYVFGEPGVVKHKIDFISLMSTRLQDMVTALVSYFSYGNKSLMIFLSLIVISLFIFFYKSKLNTKNSLVGYFLYFYIGFWILTLPLKGIMYEYYYWAFLPIFCIVVGVLIWGMFKKQASYIFMSIIVFLIATNMGTLKKQDATFFTKNTSLWLFYSAQAQSIFKDANKDFGWYVYTADQYAYSFKYAMNFMQKKYSNIHASGFKKMPLTYLMIYPSDNKYTSEVGWKTGQVKINRKSEKTIYWIGGSYVEKFNLTSEEQAVQSDSSLLQDLTFR